MRIYQLAGLAGLALTSTALFAQSFVYTNDSVTSNGVTGWSVSSSGTLTKIAGSPFATNGHAGGVALFENQNFTATRIVTSKAQNLLFASNDSDGSISVFNVNPSTGVLSLVSGSPFQALGACNTGYSLAVSPDGKTLVSGSNCSPTLQVFTVNTNGSLTVKSNRALSGCSASAGVTGSLKFTYDGQFVADADVACSAVEVFQLTSSAALQPVSGSPFKTKTAGLTNYSVDIGCAGGSLYTVGTPSGTNGLAAVSAFAMSSQGSLSELSGSPYSASGVDLQSAVLSGDDQFLVASGWYSSKFSVYSVGPGGSLTQVSGSPFGFGDLSPAQVVPSADGKFIFFAEDTGDPGYVPGVGVLALSANGTLTQVAGSPFRNPQASLTGGNDSLAVFPPKGCSTGAPSLAANPGVFIFNANPGVRTPQQTVTLTNTGGSSLTINNIKVADDIGVNLDLTSCLGTTLQAGQSCTLGASFLAAGVGTFTSSIAVTNTGLPNPLTVAIRAVSSQVSGSAISLSPAPLSFKDTVVGTASAPVLVTLTNTTASPLGLTSIAGSDTKDFTIDAKACLAKSPLAAGASCQISVQFTPKSVSSFNSSYSVNNAATSTISANGIAVKTCPDADSDGLCDDWEKNGVYVLGGTNGDQYQFIDLPHMGADSQHKDLFVHADWMETSPLQFQPHSHKPRLKGIELATAAYANGPIINPDGKNGVTLHVDCGPDCIMNPKTGDKWGTYSLATKLAEVEPLADVDGSDATVAYDWAPYDKLSATFKATGRSLVFHHAIYAHNQAKNTTSSGLSRNADDSIANFQKGASEVIISMGGWAADRHTDFAEGSTLMHELGHNLALQHGGGDSVNYKPNYLSIMSYSFQQYGLVINSSQEHMDYARVLPPVINEYNLDETVGINGGSATAAYGTAFYCPGAISSAVSPTITNTANGPIDWNCNKTIETRISSDLNAAYTAKGQAVGDKAMTGYNDWQHLNFKGGAVGGAGAGDIPATTSQGHEYDATLAELYKPLTGLSVVAPSMVVLAPGASVQMNVTVTNNGQSADSYTVTAPAVAGWFSSTAAGSTFTLQAGTSTSIPVTLSAPAGAADGTQQLVGLIVSSTGGVIVESSQTLVTVATAPSDALVFNTNTLVFGAGLTGSAVAPGTFTLTNKSPAAVSVGTITVTGDFSQTNNCGSSLAAGASCTVTVTFAPTVAGLRNGLLTINDASGFGPHTVKLTGTGTVAVALPQVNATVHSATSKPVPQSPGAIFTMYGLNLATGQNFADSLPLPTTLGGTSIMIGGYPAAMLYADQYQINAQIPFELSPGPADFQLQTADGHISSGTIQIDASSPGVFMIAGTQHAAAQNQDYSANLSSHPAAPGSVVLLYFTGQGTLDQFVATGAPSPGAPPANVVAQTTATFGGQPAQVLFSGMSPGFAGLAQANVQIPTLLPSGAPIPPGDYPVVITIGGKSADPVMVSVGQ